MHALDLSCSTTFSKTHKQTRDRHRWIGLDFIYKGKLLRSQTNTQISRYLHFSVQFFPLFDSPVESEFPLPLYYSGAGFQSSGFINSLTGNLYCSCATPSPRTPPIKLRTPVIAFVQASLHSFFLLATGGLHHHEVEVHSVCLSRTHRAIHWA